MEIRPLTIADVAAFRRIRLEALEAFPASFGTSHAEAAGRSEAEYAASITNAAPGCVFGAFDGRPMVGIAGLMINTGEKKRHKGLLWGVYVQPSHHGTGTGRALVEAVIERARAHVMILQAGVSTANAPARALYASLGFRPFGLEPKALCVDGVFHDEEHIMIDFSSPMP